MTIVEYRAIHPIKIDNGTSIAFASCSQHAFVAKIDIFIPLLIAMDSTLLKISIADTGFTSHLIIPYC